MEFKTKPRNLFSNQVEMINILDYIPDNVTDLKIIKLNEDDLEDLDNLEREFFMREE